MLDRDWLSVDRLLPFTECARPAEWLGSCDCNMGCGWLTECDEDSSWLLLSDDSPLELLLSAGFVVVFVQKKCPNRKVIKLE